MKKIMSLILLGLLAIPQVYACQFEDCENLCDRTHISGGVPLWSCAEKCAICKG